MKLVEITDTSFFNNNPDVVWSGWNRSTTQTPQINFGVHHPSGDIQKVCRKDGGGFRRTSDGQDFWRINNWDLGVTEGGSSGSGLFNENGHLIGMLTRGTAACSGTNDNGGWDEYGRFGVGWDFGGSASSRLRDWLDPGNTGVTTLDIFPAVLSVDEFALEGLIDVYPNPVNDNLNVVLTNINEDVSYTVYNTLGQQVSKGDLSANSTQIINMSQQERGIYFIKLSTASNSITRKVVKN
jgi:hypothetical protein